MAQDADTRANSWLVKVTLLLASTLTVMSGATISPSLPAMQAHFADVANAEFWVRLVLTIPALFIVIGSPIAGQMVDKIGRKPLLLGSAVLYGFAGSSGFVLDSLFAILTGRALLGLAVAGIMISATTLIADYYEGPARANFMGLQAAFMGFGGVLFLSVGGFIAEMSWRFPFLIYLFSWLLLPTIAGALYEPARHSKGSRNISSGNISSGETPTAQSTDSSGQATALPIKLLILIYGAVFLQQVIFYLIPVRLPFYLEQIANIGASQTGIAIACATLFSAFASMRYGAIKQRFSFISLLAISFGLMGIGYVGIGLASSYWMVILALIPTGLGLGLMMPNLNVWLSNEVPNSLRGRALGGMTTFMFLGQFLSPILSQPASQSLGLPSTYGLAGIVLGVSASIVWIFKKQICHTIASTVGTATLAK